MLERSLARALLILELRVSWSCLCYIAFIYVSWSCLCYIAFIYVSWSCLCYLAFIYVSWSCFSGLLRLSSYYIIRWFENFLEFLKYVDKIDDEFLKEIFSCNFYFRFSLSLGLL